MEVRQPILCGCGWKPMKLPFFLGNNHPLTSFFRVPSGDQGFDPSPCIIRWGFAPTRTWGLRTTLTASWSRWALCKMNYKWRQAPITLGILDGNADVELSESSWVWPQPSSMTVDGFSYKHAIGVSPFVERPMFFFGANCSDLTGIIGIMVRKRNHPEICPWYTLIYHIIVRLLCFCMFLLQ